MQDEAEQELIAMMGAFVESLAMMHQIPCDFDGLSLNVLRDPDTHQLQAVVITPVDAADDAESPPVPRYKVDASRIRMGEAPRIVLAQ
jgi:hypothetical protein